MAGLVTPMRHLWQERDRRQKILFPILHGTCTTPSSVLCPDDLSFKTMFFSCQRPYYSAHIQPPNVLKLFS